MNLSGNALVMKEVNINLVRRTLKAKIEATKQQLAQETGLSLVTVGTVLQQLVQNGEVFDADMVASSGGRPAHRFRFNENYAHALIVFTQEHNELATAYLRVVNLFGDSICGQNVELEDVTMECFEPYIESLLIQYPTIRAIGFGLPGVEFEGRMIVTDHPGLIGKPIVGHYSELYELPVLVENDVNAAVIGFCRRRQVACEAAALYLYFPGKSPPGSGIYIDGKLYKGNGGFAGEVASVPLGIDWCDTALYDDFEKCCDATARLIVSICSIINPYTIIMHASFITPEHIEGIAKRCAEQLPKGVVPTLGISQNFLQDYQYGMAFETLALLEPQASLTL